MRFHPGSVLLLAVAITSCFISASHARPARPVPIASLTAAPLRNQVVAVLEAPLDTVWALVGEQDQLPRYSGVVRVDVDHSHAKVRNGVGCRRRCYFPGGGTFDEVVRWYDPPRAFASSAPDGPAREAGDVSVVELQPLGAARTRFSWQVLHDYPDVAAANAGYEPGLNDIAERLVARFGGWVVARAAAGPVVPRTHP